MVIGDKQLIFIADYWLTRMCNKISKILLSKYTSRYIGTFDILIHH